MLNTVTIVKKKKEYFKKFLGFLLLSFSYFSSAYSKEDPKFFSCENSFGIYKIYLKYHFTDLNKYDVVTNKFIKVLKKKIPTLELHKEEDFEKKNYKKLLTLYIQINIIIFLGKPSFYSSSDPGKTVDFILNRYNLLGRNIEHKGMLHPSRKTKINDKIIDEILLSNDVRLLQCKEIEFKQKI